MKIGVVIERLEAWRGGAEISTMQFIRGLMARGCAVSVFTASPVASSPGLHVHHIRVPTLLRSRRMAGFARRARAAIGAADLDLVHAISPVGPADIYQPRGGLLAETLRRNVAMRSRPAARRLKRLAAALNTKHRILVRLERGLLAPTKPGVRPPLVIAVSEYVARQVAEHYGEAAPPVRVVFNGVDIEPATPEQRSTEAAGVRQQYGIEPGELLLLLVAHNFALKGLGPLIRALRLLADRGLPAKLLVVGRDNPIRFQRQAVALGVADRIIFAGPTQRMRSLYLAADVLVHPTYYDPCSRVVLEALAYGLPCITTRFNGAAEAMTDGQEGYVIDSPDDTEALADRITRLADTTHRATCAAAAQRLRAKVSMHRQVDEILAIYRERIGDSAIGRS